MKQVFEKDIQAVIELLATPKKIIVTGHQNPDGDAMSSTLGLSLFLKKYGHHSTVIVPNDFHDFLQWMPGTSEVLIHQRLQTLTEKLIADADILFCLDYNDPSRVEKMETAIVSAKAVKIMIDHHPMPSDFANFTFSDTSVSSTAELVFEFISILDSKQLIDSNIAECLFTGITTDTGCFNFNSSQPRTYEIAAKLLNYSISKEKIIRNIYDNFSHGRMKLMGYCLHEKMVIIPELHTGFIALSKSELEQFDFNTGDTEGFVNLPLSIKGINFTAFFVEKDDRVKISFRSRGAFDVNEFSRNHFNGGGHRNASGGKMFKSLQETIDIFNQTIVLYKENLEY